MSTQAQIHANQANAQHSTGPKTDESKAVSAMNNFKYGLTGAKFYILPDEDYDEFDHLRMGLRYEHKPTTMTESILVEKMATSYWLAQRALKLQNSCLCDEDLTPDQQQKLLAVYLRYQTTHDRAFNRALADLLKLRAEKRKAEIGFESQQQRQAAESRREASEKRKQERHKWDILLTEAKVDHQIVLNASLENAQGGKLESKIDAHATECYSVGR